MSSLVNPQPENQRAAINVKISLASNLITVALAFIGAQGAITVFVLDKRENLTWFYAAELASFLVLAISIVFGGRGIAKAYRDGYSGNWSLADGGCFNVQSVLCIVGAALVLLSSMLGTRRVEAAPVPQNGHEIPEMQEQIRGFKKENDDIRQRLSSLAVARAPAGRRRRARSSVGRKPLLELKHVGVCEPPLIAKP
jgi:hypothetical protein